MLSRCHGGWPLFGPGNSVHSPGGGPLSGQSHLGAQDALARALTPRPCFPAPEVIPFFDFLVENRLQIRASSLESVSDEAFSLYRMYLPSEATGDRLLIFG